MTTDNTNAALPTASQKDETKKSSSCFSCLARTYSDNEFLILVIIAILLARAYPPIGAEYLAPDITATWIAVCIIFVLAGLGLKTAELTKAFKNFKFNIFVQVFNIGVVSSIVFGITRGLLALDWLSQDLADGLVIAASLPMTINMVLVLTRAAHGDAAAALCNAALGNLLGVFVSPILILGYLGVTGDVDLFEVFYKLALRVVIPVLVGQILQKTSKTVVDFVTKHKKHFKKAQEYLLVFIVYTVFCETFENESSSSIGDIFITVLLVILILAGIMIAAWYILGLLWPKDPELRVMGLFGCSHKTVAMGVPLINAMYQGNPAVGLYTLPLLIWHPAQLVVGTFLAPRLAKYVENNTKSTEKDDENNKTDAALPAVQRVDTEKAHSSSSINNGENENDKIDEDPEQPTTTLVTNETR